MCSPTGSCWVLLGVLLLGILLLGVLLLGVLLLGILLLGILLLGVVLLGVLLLGVLLLGFQLNQPPCSARSQVLVFGIGRSTAGGLVVGGYMAGLGFGSGVEMACLDRAMWVSCVG